MGPESFKESVAYYLGSVTNAVYKYSDAKTPISPFMFVEDREGVRGSCQFPGKLIDSPKQELQGAVDDMRGNNIYRFGFMMNALMTPEKMRHRNMMHITEMEEMLETATEVISVACSDPWQVELYATPLYRRHDIGDVQLGDWESVDVTIHPYLQTLRRGVCPQG